LPPDAKRNFKEFLIEGSTARGFFSLIRVALEFARGFARQFLAGSGKVVSLC
jgi:hypothetical protein